MIVEGSGRKRKYAAAKRLCSFYYKVRRNRDGAVALEAFEEVVNRLDAVKKSRILMACRCGFKCKGRLSMIQNQLESVLSTIGEVVESLVG